MSKNIAVSVQNLGKSYVIKHEEARRPSNFREALLQAPLNFLRRGKAVGSTSETFWALKNISFEVERGQVFGIIGRNGAGKSTLLKILSRITEPTTGLADIHGRVGSLLEVGTGFHPELTGRENIFLNGTLLGMRKKQIDKVFDEIVAFSEVERFLDTPVKRYSSGMYVRLAFAVAAHLQPDILIIDEVLAVGDFQFQKKCLGKMRDVTGEGRTVLFVSHNLTTVNSLCDRCILLNEGKVETGGPTEEVTRRYFGSGDHGGPTISFSSPDEMPGDEIVRLHSANLVSEDGNPLEFAQTSQKVGIEMAFEIVAKNTSLVPYIHLLSQGQLIFISSPRTYCSDRIGMHRVVMWIPDWFLNEGSYSANLVIATMEPMKVHFQIQDHFFFNVVDNINDEGRHGYVRVIPGLLRPRMQWDID